MTKIQRRITDLEGKRGVYWVTNWWWSIYVGKSNDIGQRLRGHMRNGSDLGKYLDRRPNASIHHLTRWQSLEVPLIKLLRPWLNKQHNPRRRNRRRNGRRNKRRRTRLTKLTVTTLLALLITALLSGCEVKPADGIECLVLDGDKLVFITCDWSEYKPK